MLFGFRPFGKSCLCKLGEFVGSALQMRKQIGDIGLRGSRETRPDWIGHAVPPCFVERRLQGSQGRLLACPAVRRERARSPHGIDPACRHRHDLLVQARCARSVDGEPAEQHDARDCIRGDRKTGLGQVVMDQALRGEPAKQAPGHAVLEMQVHGVFAETSGVLESHGPDGRPTAPLAEALISPPPRAQRIECRGPTGIARKRMVSSGKDEAARSVRLPLLFPIGLGDCGSAGESQAHRQGLAELRRSEADMGSRPFQASAQAIHFLAQPVLAKTRVLELVLDGAPPFSGRKVPDGGRETVDPVTAHAFLADGPGDTRFEHLRGAAELLANAFHLVHQHLQDTIFRPLDEDEVTAEHLVGWLQLAVDAAVALVETARVPGQIEMTQVMAMALEIEALPRRVGGDENAQRVVARLGVEGVLDVFPPVPGGRPGEGLDPFVCLVGMNDGLVQAALKPAARVFVFGEDEKATVVPLRRHGPERRLNRAHVGVDPLDDPAHARIGVVATCLGDLAHFVDESQFAHQRRPCFRTPAVGRCRCRRRHQFGEVEFRRIGSFWIVGHVGVGIDTAVMISRIDAPVAWFLADGQPFEIGLQLGGNRDGLRGLLQHAFHTPAMYREGFCEGLDG